MTEVLVWNVVVGPLKTLIIPCANAVAAPVVRIRRVSTFFIVAFKIGTHRLAERKFGAIGPIYQEMNCYILDSSLTAVRPVCGLSWVQRERFSGSPRLFAVVYDHYSRQQFDFVAIKLKG